MDGEHPLAAHRPHINFSEISWTTPIGPGGIVRGRREGVNSKLMCGKF